MNNKNGFEYEIIRITEKKELIPEAAEWFSKKWNIPKSAYIESMNDALSTEKGFPQWYLAIKGGKIIGGLGIIENDFHERKDLSPNVCAVFVEESARKNGIARALLNFVCNDMKEKGIDTLYLLTDHTSFYERCGWEYLCPVFGDGEKTPSRMYVHKSL